MGRRSDGPRMRRLHGQLLISWLLLVGGVVSASEDHFLSELSQPFDDLLAVDVGSRQLQAADAALVATPDYAYYHKKEGLLAGVKALVASRPDIMRLDMAQAADGEYSVELQVVTVSLSGLSNSTAHVTSRASILATQTADALPITNPTQQHQQPNQRARIFMDFGEHGREFVSSELGLLLLKTLADPAALTVALGGDLTAPRAARVMATLQRSELVILPMENTRGREHVEAGNLCERKNGRGVDPNRNWPVDWGKKEKDYDPNEEFPGTGPFSEPEVRIVQGIAAAWQPHVWLNIHSGMEAMFTPYDHRAEVPAGAVEALALLHQLHTNMRFTNSCVVGSGGKSVGYLAHGTATDYMFDILKIPMSYTWEIYGDFAAAFNDCFRMFNPLTAPALEAVLQTWMQAIFTLLELLPTHPATAFLLTEPGQAVMEGAGGGALKDSVATTTASTLAVRNNTTLARSGEISGSEGQDHNKDQQEAGSATASAHGDSLDLESAGVMDAKDGTAAAQAAGGVALGERGDTQPRHQHGKEPKQPLLEITQGTLTMQHTALLQSAVGLVSLLLVVAVAVRCARWGWLRRRAVGSGSSGGNGSSVALPGRGSGVAPYSGNPRLHARPSGQRLSV